ncbi:MAG: DUF4293 domain-containing protein [Prevotellaceae bacterium]|nr:DUF4293 domain-containing protein [Prevotellaceae bacterium]
MIQRKQTIFLLLAIVFTIACLCLPVGSFSSGIGENNTIYNLWIVTANGSHDYSVWALFAILLVTCPISIAAIFSYHNRIVQSRFCLFNMLLILGWYIVLAVFTLGMEGAENLKLSFYTAFPAVALILYFMARKAILADEALVRSADRIR